MNVSNMVKPLHVTVVFDIIKSHTSEKPHKYSQCDKVLHIMISLYKIKHLICNQSVKAFAYNDSF